MPHAGAGNVKFHPANPVAPLLVVAEVPAVNAAIGVEPGDGHGVDIEDLNPRNTTVYWQFGFSEWIVSPSVASMAAHVKSRPITGRRVGRRGREDPSIGGKDRRSSQTYRS